ncbi:MAG: hypothetical protein DHS80DRAFT_31833 [Piptocephalis tieghemiana]|nr:MAG: hypothetical protein DHS80DRAFT_31833 [Piptocephalis tieghemiana]
MASNTLANIFNPSSLKRKNPALLLFPEEDPTSQSPSPVSYPQLHKAILHTALLLKLALNPQPGQTVATIFPNSPECIISFLAITCSRLTCAPLNPAYGRAEVDFYLEDTKPLALLVPKGWVSQGKEAVKVAWARGCKVGEVQWVPSHLSCQILWYSPPPNRNHPTQHHPRTNEVVESLNPKPDEVALILHTSGTTGRPKAVPLTHENISRTMGNIIRTYQLSPSDTSLIIMPLFHVHGLIGALLSTLGSGGTAALAPRFSAHAFWAQVTHSRATWYSAVPTIHSILLTTSPPTTHTLRFIRSCSSSLAPATLAKVEASFHAPVLEAYAMTEAAHQMTSNPLPPSDHKPGSVGIPQGVDLRILDTQGKEMPQGQEGEVCIQGVNVTKGYRDNPKANESSFWPGGWFRTGDRGKLDPQGYLFLTGRIKELINRGGEKIGPLEVDACVLECPGVSEAVCFALPDKLYGEIVGLAVVLSDDAKAEGAESASRRIKQWCKDHLSSFKVPSKIWVLDHIEKGATGKVQRPKVREQCFNIVKSNRSSKL